MTLSPLFQPLTLPNGTQLINRLGKAAMEENLADPDHAPGAALRQLYRAWAEGGAGLLITGNVMVDARAMTGPGGVVLEDDSALARFKAWAEAGRAGGAQFWMQINHPGRQVYAAMGQAALAPSAVAVNIPGFSSLFAKPKAMTADDIRAVIHRFANTAALAEQAGFTGVQIHAAHGYLLSQFLSPLTNLRHDEWGGSLDNRARLLIEVVKAVRNRVSPTFCVAVKLNSADFQRGGFEPADARAVIAMLNKLGVDLVELSGGSYESPAMQGQAGDGRTLAREAYFLEFAKDLTPVAQMPLMVTGRINRRETAERVLQEGVAVAGMAQALALNPSLPDRWREAADNPIALAPIKWKIKALRSLALMAVIKAQLRLISDGKSPNPSISPLKSLIFDQIDTRARTGNYRRWISSHRFNSQGQQL